MRLFVLLVCVLSAALWARPINDGNKLFAKGDYAGALEKYMKAREAEPANPLLFYNIGTCQYKLGNYAEAKKELESAVRMPDKKMAAKAAYNLANTHFRMGEKAARKVASGECEMGVLICGTGIGISMAANRVRGVRAAVCSEPYSAELSRRHNNANMIAFGARVVGGGLACSILDAFFSAEFEGGRHANRVEMLEHIEP